MLLALQEYFRKQTWHCTDISDLILNRVWIHLIKMVLDLVKMVDFDQ